MTVHRPGTESGDRHAFLARATSRAARDHVDNLAHPLPAPGLGDGPVPIGYRALDAADPVGSFIRNATGVLLDVHRVPAVLPTDDFLRALIETESVTTVVTSTEPLAVAVGARLTALGCRVALHTPELAAGADLGVTAPRWGIAATGSLVQDSSAEGGRAASLLPRTHLAVLPADRIVATTADVLSSFASRPDGMPANVVLITGPSRTGDIEMILTIGVHGPVKVVVAVVDPAQV